MLRLAVLALALAGLAAGALLVPFRGRTVADRWHAAPDAVAFAGSAWRELRGQPEPKARPERKAQRQAARAERAEGGRTRPAPPSRPPAAERTAPQKVPAEHHTDADRAALDRLLSERARRP
jgi:hypothetical protein